MTDRPLVTFLVVAYNQERFIREAIKGAFSQTYYPLEIILSDDCSSDCTFAIMQEMSECYKGPHKVVLNRNDHNFGLPNHMNEILSLSSGKYIISSAGDDISLPDRTKVSVSILNADNDIQCTVTEMISIDRYSRLTGSWNICPAVRKEGVYSIDDLIHNKAVPHIGCSMAWRKNLWLTFGPFASNFNREDSQIKFWALLAGKLYATKIKTVLYRVHDMSLSHTIDLNYIPFSGIKQMLSSLNISRKHNYIGSKKAIEIKGYIRALMLRRKLFKQYPLSFPNLIIYFCSSSFSIKEKLLFALRILNLSYIIKAYHRVIYPSNNYDSE